MPRCSTGSVRQQKGLFQRDAPPSLRSAADVDQPERRCSGAETPKSLEGSRPPPSPRPAAGTGDDPRRYASVVGSTKPFLQRHVADGRGRTRTAAARSITGRPARRTSPVLGRIATPRSSGAATGTAPQVGPTEPSHLPSKGMLATQPGSTALHRAGRGISIVHSQDLRAVQSPTAGWSPVRARPSVGAAPKPSH